MGFFRRMLFLISFFLGLFLTLSSGCQNAGNECWSSTNGAASGGCCDGTQCGPWSPNNNPGMEVLPGIAFPCQGSHLVELATMMPKLDYALKELIVAMVSALLHAQHHQLLQQQLPQLLLQLPLQQLLLLHPQPQPPQPQQQQNNAQLSPGICVSMMQPLLDIPKRVAHHTLVKQFKLASACAPELIFLKDQNAGPTLTLQEHVRMGFNVLT